MRKISIGGNYPLLPNTLSGPGPCFKISVLGSLTNREANDRFDLHKHLSYHIIWLTGGSGYIKSAGSKYLLHTDLVYCFPSGRINDVFIEPGSEGFAFSFDADFVNMKESNFYFLFGMWPGKDNVRMSFIKIEKDLKTEMFDVANNLAREFDNAYFLRSEVLRNLLKTFLIYLRRHMGKDAQIASGQGNEGLARKFYELLGSNISTKMSVSEYASLLGISPNYLNQIIKKYSGQTVSHHIQQRIVFEAKRKAECEALSMKEIAYFLGFECTAHFSKYFKKVTGNCFRDFKKGLSYA